MEKEYIQPSKNTSPKLLKIEIESLRLRAYIGYLDWEKVKLQDLILSFSFTYDAAMAILEDDVTLAPNYKELTKIIIELVDNQSFHLVETLAEKLYQAIRKFDESIQDIEVKVEKPHALRFADNVIVKISSEDCFNTALIALGSNIQPEGNLALAIEYLQRLGKVVSRSEFVQTKAMKFEQQPDFLNGAILLYTTLSLPYLELELKQIETLMGRVRTENKNGPRIIDLDVLTFNGSITEEKDLVELPFLYDFVKQLQPESLK